MTIDTDMHSHVSRSSALQMALAAQQKGLRVLGLSEHVFQMEETPKSYYIILNQKGLYSLSASMPEMFLQQPLRQTLKYVWVWKWTLFLKRMI